MKRLKKNDAEYCRLKGWRTGTILTMDWSPLPGRVFADRCRITAVGEESILVRRIYDEIPSHGEFEGPEERWARRLLDREVLAANHLEVVSV